MWRVALAGGETLTHAVPDHRDRLPVPAAGSRHPRHRDLRRARSSTPPTGTTTTTSPGKRVAVIGTGATAVQLIPELAKSAAELTVYQRTPIWVVPKIDLRSRERRKRLFARVPFTQRALRWHHRLCLRGDDGHRGAALPQVPRGSTSPRPTCRQDRTGSPRSATRSCAAELTPDYDFGCKRPTFSNGYYRDVHQAARAPADDAGIERIEPDGIVTNDGTRRIDTLVLATGFDLWEANFPAIEVIGRDGPQPRKVVARHQVPGLPGRVDAVLPELPEPGQPVRVPRVELLQHDGVPDAAHGPAVRRGATPRRDDVRGHRGGQHPLPGPDDRASANRCSTPATARRRTPTTSTTAARRRCCGPPRHATRCGNSCSSRWPTTRSADCHFAGRSTWSPAGRSSTRCKASRPRP